MKSEGALLAALLRAHADALVRHGPPKYRTDDEGSGDEQLWQREVGKQQGDCWTFSAAGREATLDWASGAARLSR